MAFIYNDVIPCQLTPQPNVNITQQTHPRMSAKFSTIGPPVGRFVEVDPSVWKNAVRIEHLTKKKNVFQKDERYYLLSSDYILYWFIEKDSTKAQNSLRFDEYQLLDVPSPPNSFKLQFEGRSLPKNGQESYWIVCPSAESKEEWMRIKEDRNFLLNLSSSGRMIKKSDLTITSTSLGEGGSGAVSLGNWSGERVAIKTLKNELSQEEISEFQKEIEVLARLHHPYVLRMWGGCIDRENKGLLLVTEYLEGGDLGKYIHDKIGYPSFSTRIVQRIALNIAHGMKYIHELGIVHKDLKPGNILVKDINKGDIKICDFGLTATPHAFGTPLYAAPEMPQECTPAVDSFSFGIILWEMFTRQRPLSDEPGLFPAQITDKYKSGYRPPLTPGVKLPSLITKCWDPVPENRHAFREVVDIMVNLEDNFQQSEYDTLMEIFSGEEKISWEEFKSHLCSTYGCEKAAAESIKKILCQAEKAERTKVQDFFEKRFLIVPEEDARKDVWTIDELSILIGGKPWFNDVDGQLAEKMLLNSDIKDGTYLVRFSSNINHLVLVAKHGEKTYHMRIRLKNEGEGNWRISANDDRDFDNLEDLIKYYKSNEWVAKDCSFVLGAHFEMRGDVQYSNPQ
eukprot:TRINITY_DN1439_c0_g1_i1.p1 TRINITY_DN1439_c0_g1~~TRINITY_DN1439_c0_g1_i1.p1  ORF type:complete len:623 (-),score=154.90 TRINITY_DN1439_c0_g1_i1:618-2486(-)